MPFKVQIGPPQISIHQGQTVLISEPDGQINWPSERGLYFLDTRVVSSWAVYANGETWELLNGGAITYYAARIFLTNHSFATENGTIPPRTLGFTISRWIGGGMHEDLDITNNGMKPVKFQLEIAIRCDFAVSLRSEIRQYCTPGAGQVIHENVNMDRLMDRALELSGYHEKRKRFEAGNPGKIIRKGIGFASFFHGAGFTGSGEEHLASEVAAEATREGRVRLMAASTEMGQGTNTIFSADCGRGPWYRSGAD